MSEPLRLAIIMDGGVIQQIITAGVPIEVVVVDYDVEGVDESELVTLDDDGPAYVFSPAVDDDPEARAFVMKAFEVIDDQH